MTVRNLLCIAYLFLSLFRNGENWWRQGHGGENEKRRNERREEKKRKEERREEKRTRMIRDDKNRNEEESRIIFEIQEEGESSKNSSNFIILIFSGLRI